MRKFIFGAAGWIVTITAVHMAINVNWELMVNERLPESERKLNVGYIPVT